MSDSAVTVYEPQAFEMSVSQVKAQIVKIQTLMKDLMTEGEHYGASFPGDTKKNLLKPGADKLCFMFRLRPEFDQQLTDLPNQHREVLSKCQIFHVETGVKISEGVGSCSTMEGKYRWRNSARKCPVCGKEAIIKGKEEYGGGWICFKKKDGCGATFDIDDPQITGQESGKVENTDIADTYNTVLKQSKKRAYVDAVITACAASDIFTQDLEELTREMDGANAKKAESVAKPGLSAIAQRAQAAKDAMVNLGKAAFSDGTLVLTDANRATIKSQIEKSNAAAKNRKEWTEDDVMFLEDALGVWKKKCSELMAGKKEPPKTMAAEALDDSPKEDLDAAADAGFNNQKSELDIF
jgi:hypothetical protein